MLAQVVLPLKPVHIFIFDCDSCGGQLRLRLGLVVSSIDLLLEDLDHDTALLKTA